MRVELQKICIDVETVLAMTNASDGCPEQLLGSMSGSLIPQCQEPVETLSDQEYAKVMEERYGIREEGIF